MHGYVGADIAAVCREAGIKAYQRVHPLGAFSSHPSSVSLAYGDPLTDAHATSGTRTSNSRDSEVEVTVTVGDLRVAATEVRPSAMREVVVDVPRVLWSDIGGNETVKQQLQEAVTWPLKVCETACVRMCGSVSLMIPL
jgi:AAA family ATPase